MVQRRKTRALHDIPSQSSFTFVGHSLTASPADAQQNARARQLSGLLRIMKALSRAVDQ